MPFPALRSPATSSRVPSPPGARHHEQRGRGCSVLAAGSRGRGCTQSALVGVFYHASSSYAVILAAHSLFVLVIPLVEWCYIQNLNLLVMLNLRRFKQEPSFYSNFIPTAPRKQPLNASISHFQEDLDAFFGCFPLLHGHSLPLKFTTTASSGPSSGPSRHPHLSSGQSFIHDTTYMLLSHLQGAGGTLAVCPVVCPAHYLCLTKHTYTTLWRRT